MKVNTVNIKRLIRKTLSLGVFYLHITGKFRDFIMWPIATRLLGSSYKETLILRHKCIAFQADMSDIVGRMILFYGEHVDYAWEPGTTSFLEKIIQNAHTSIIAGTHIGYTISNAAYAMPNDGVIYGFEPVSYLFQLSKTNAELTSKNIVITKKALGEKDDQIDIHVDGVRSSLTYSHKLQGKPTEKVEVTSIGNFIKKNNIPSIDLIFLDVEGNEFSALKGCQETVFKQEKKPDIIFEMLQSNTNRGDETGQEITVFLKSYGYSLFVIEDDYSATNLYDHSKTSAAVLTPLLEYSKKHADRYINVYATQHNRFN